MSNPELLSIEQDDEPVPLIWYASYGSNMNAARFACYLAGGTPVGGSRNYVGCTDKSLPLADIAVDLPQSLYFAGESKVWTGGLAFISHKPGDEPTRSRAYLITADQFKEVVAQESWRAESLDINWSRLRKIGHITLGDGSGSYDELVYCGERDGYPVVSFTSPKERRPYVKPAEAYVRMIGTGLMEAQNINAEEAANYLSKKPGILDQYTVENLANIISS